MQGYETYYFKSEVYHPELHMISKVYLLAKIMKHSHEILAESKRPFTYSNEDLIAQYHETYRTFDQTF